MNLIPSDEQIRVISVDVFDTLIFRGLNQPKDLFLSVYRKAVEEGLLSEYIQSGDFQKIRMEAERKFYLQGLYPTLEQIYEQFPQGICTDIDRMIELEQICEQEYCYRNDEIYEQLQALYNEGKILYIVSDMYLTKPRMVSLLRACNISTEIFTDILISCDYGVAKSDGDLFKVLLKQCGCESEQICHIGDNYNSDVRLAIQCGIRAVYYPVKDYANEYLQVERVLEGDLAPELQSIRKQVARDIAVSDLSEHQKQMQTYGAMILAPFYVSATEWLLDLLEQENTAKVFFLMREGALFKKLFDQAQLYRSNTIISELFYSSRNSLFLPGQNELTGEDVKKHLEEFKKEIVTVLGCYQLFEIEDLYPDALRGFETVRIRDLSETEYTKFVESLTEEENVRCINRNIISVKDNCIKYIQSTGSDAPSVAVVDLGYKGSAQTLLDRLSKHQHLNVLYLGKSGCIDRMQDGHKFVGYYSTCGQGEQYLNQVLNAGAPFEAILMRGDGCTVSYDCEGKPIQTPVKNIPREQFEDMSQIHEGMLRYQKIFLEVSHRNEVVRNVTKRPEDLFRILGRSFLYPCMSEVKLLAPILNEENFGTEVARDVYIAAIENEAELPKTRKDGKRYWKMGVLAYSNPLYYIKSRYILNNQLDEIPLIDVVAEHSDLKRVVIVGAGLAGERMLTYCLAAGIEVECFMDNDVRKQGGMVLGYPVRTPGDPIDHVDAFLVASIKYKQKLSEQFRNLYGKDVF